ncbi:hypothetical protein [Bacillus thermotolerans]|uniref:hypothetical protein n=1 Tax=Bacillus thermotolerans TaxID=1221996 RepID=UPI00057D3410|nr:hypothetical protein [Bacillus thermotolerans]KKB36460.1 ATPase component BioM of energizing module of biotin ECF transporter [Bacillus thermotolerans]
MSGNIIHYFARGNTAKGLYHLLESNLYGIKKIFLLDGGTASERTNFFNELSNQLVDQGKDVELLHCPLDSHVIEGLIAVKEETAVLAKGAAPSLSGPNVQVLRLSYSPVVPANQREHVKKLKEQAEAARQNAYTCFQHALAVHDEWEAIYIQQLDRKRANELSNEWINRLLPTVTRDRKAVIKHRFLGAATSRGAVDFVQNLTEGLANRYFIKGRPGTGKSTMLKKIVAASEERGYDTEVYHCGFDPGSLDMVIVRELGFAIFDSTAPHEYFPEKPTDQVLDLYREIVAAGTDEKNEASIKEIAGRYRSWMNQATAHLNESNRCYQQIEACSAQARDEKAIKDACEKVLKSI